MIKNIYCLRAKDNIYVVLKFSQQILEDTQISNFTKIRPVGVMLLRADRRTCFTKLITAFRNFADPFKNTVLCSIFTRTSTPHSINNDPVNFFYVSTDN